MPDLWDTKSRTTPSARPMSSPNQPQRQQRPHQGGAAQGPPRPPPATRLCLDRAGDALVAILLLLAGVLFAPD
jgi:hypothetical protein